MVTLGIHVRLLGYALLLAAAVLTAMSALLAHTWVGRTLFAAPAGASLTFGVGFLAITRGRR